MQQWNFLSYLLKELKKTACTAWNILIFSVNYTFIKREQIFNFAYQDTYIKIKKHEIYHYTGNALPNLLPFVQFKKREKHPQIF